jgi:hypothetical protein
MVAGQRRKCSRRTSRGLPSRTQPPTAQRKVRLGPSSFVRAINERSLGSIVLFAEARRQAKELDDEFAATKKLRGPLHGVPFSVKDPCKSPTHFFFSRVRTVLNIHLSDDVAGVDSSIGFSQWTGRPAPEDAHVEFSLASRPPLSLS